jgi:L-ascorbate metabolism protein UlaG (beta-lactamase superfamily)
MQIRYLGWSAFELTTQQGTKIVLDPMLSGRPDLGIPPSPVPIDALYSTNFVLVTHAAADHVGQAFEIMKNSEAALVCDGATRHMASEAGIPEDRIYRMLSGVRFEFGDFAVKALAAQHHSLGKMEHGFVTAQPLSYLIETATDDRIFFGGDTFIHGDMKLYGELYRPHVAILGVGGVDVNGQSLTLLSPEEAVLVVQWLRVQKAIPIHYRFDEGEKFIQALKANAPDIEGLLLKPGNQYTW